MIFIIYLSYKIIKLKFLYGNLSHFTLFQIIYFNNNVKFWNNRTDMNKYESLSINTMSVFMILKTSYITYRINDYYIVYLSFYIFLISCCGF